MRLTLGEAISGASDKISDWSSSVAGASCVQWFRDERRTCRFYRGTAAAFQSTRETREHIEGNPNF